MHLALDAHLTRCTCTCACVCVCTCACACECVWAYRDPAKARQHQVRRSLLPAPASHREVLLDQVAELSQPLGGGGRCQQATHVLGECGGGLVACEDLDGLARANELVDLPTPEHTRGGAVAEDRPAARRKQSKETPARIVETRYQFNPANETVDEHYNRVVQLAKWRLKAGASLDWMEVASLYRAALVSQSEACRIFDIQMSRASQLDRLPTEAQIVLAIIKAELAGA